MRHQEAIHASARSIDFGPGRQADVDPRFAGKSVGGKPPSQAAAIYLLLPRFVKLASTPWL